MFPCEDSKTVSVCPYPEKRYHHSFVNISPTLAIDTSMERSSRVLHHENQKIWFFFSRSSKLNSTRILTCAEELKSFYMNLYVDIGDASSSLWGSTSSYKLYLHFSYFITNFIYISYFSRIMFLLQILFKYLRILTIFCR